MWFYVNRVGETSVILPELQTSMFKILNSDQETKQDLPFFTVQEQEEISDKQTVYTVVNGWQQSFLQTLLLSQNEFLTLCERNHLKVVLFGPLWDMVPNQYLALNEPWLKTYEQPCYQSRGSYKVLNTWFDISPHFSIL